MTLTWSRGRRASRATSIDNLRTDKNKQSIAKTSEIRKQSFPGCSRCRRRPSLLLILPNVIAATAQSGSPIRWRLQKAFYSPKGQPGCCGSCVGIYCYDCFPGTCWCRPPARPEGNQVQALTLNDLTDNKPEYISNIVINGWKKDTSEKSKHFRLMTMTPKRFEVIDYQPKKNCSSVPSTGDGNPGYVEEHPEAHEQQESPQNEGIPVGERNVGGTADDAPDSRFGDTSLGPKDIKLSSAMAMSAAALSPHLGAFVQAEQSVTHVLTILGLEMAARIVYNIAGERSVRWYWRVSLYRVSPSRIRHLKVIITQ